MNDNRTDHNDPGNKDGAMTSNPGRHGVAVTVFLDADGIDARDAHHVGEQAVREVITAAGDTLTTHTYLGKVRTARVVEVIGTGTALPTGCSWSGQLTRGI